MVLPDDGERQAAPGASFILQWFQSIFAGDEYARSATRRVLTEVSRGVAACVLLAGSLCCTAVLVPAAATPLGDGPGGHRGCGPRECLLLPALPFFFF